MRGLDATMRAMNARKYLFPVIAILLLVVAWRSYGWAGVALVVSAGVMVVLIQFNRAMGVLRRAADRPVGTVGSAVMLNAKLKPRLNLMRVVAMTGAIGEPRSPKETQPEIFRWTDESGSWVDATFVAGRLAEWSLVRPTTADEAEEAQADTSSSDAIKPGAADALRPPV